LVGLFVTVGCLLPVVFADAAAPPAPDEAGFGVTFPKREPKPPTDPADKAARAHCKASAFWEFIGAFRLKDGDATRLVCLYARDSDNNAYGCCSIPNFFAILAVYQDDSGKWKQVEVHSATRTKYGRVINSSPDGVVVELRGNFPVFIRPEWSEAERREWLEVGRKANAPCHRRVRFDQGALVSDDCGP
jgi:hypothetical protein